MTPAEIAAAEAAQKAQLASHPEYKDVQTAGMRASAAPPLAVQAMNLGGLASATDTAELARQQAAHQERVRQSREALVWIPRGLPMREAGVVEPAASTAFQVADMEVRISFVDENRRTLFRRFFLNDPSAFLEVCDQTERGQSISRLFVTDENGLRSAMVIPPEVVLWAPFASELGVWLSRAGVPSDGSPPRQRLQRAVANLWNKRYTELGLAPDSVPYAEYETLRAKAEAAAKQAKA